jgi:hypothetical protein
MWSLETSRCQGRPHLEKFDTPSLVVQGMSDTGVFPKDARDIHGFIASRDKSLELIPGAHYFEDSRDHRHAMVSLVCDWARRRL